MADDESKAKVEEFPSLEHQLAAENLEGYVRRGRGRPVPCQPRWQCAAGRG